MSFSEVKDRLRQYADHDEKLSAILVCGEAYDYDIILATKSPEDWLYGNASSVIGEIGLFNVGNVYGFPALNVLCDHDLDIRLVALTPETLQKAIENGSIRPLLCQGYSILYDTAGIGKFLAAHTDFRVAPSSMSRSAYLDTVSAFWFYAVRTGRRLLADELYSALHCFDRELHPLLLKMIESFHAETQAPVRHYGKDLERWANEETRNELRNCFAKYSKEDIASSLLAVTRLFNRLARAYARKSRFEYPQAEEQYAWDFLESNFIAREKIPQKLLVKERTVLRYRSDDGLTDIPVIADGAQVWLSLPAMANLLQVTEMTVKTHIAKAYRERQYEKSETMRSEETKDGPLPYYNLDILIDVGYQLLSLRVSYFRVWLRGALSDYTK